MSSKTPNVDLYKADKVADADQTFNIDTMLNENWDKVDAAIGEMRTEIGEIEPEIPDASTTQKGIVQLDDTTNSTSKGKAATADAVRRVQAAVDTKMEKDRYPNLLMNPTGMLGMLGWKPSGGNTTGWAATLDTLTGGTFSQNSETGPEYRVLDSATFPVNAGSTYTLGVHFAGTAATGRMYVEVQTAAGASINTVVNDGPGYHRKTMQVVIPGGVASVFVRLGVQPNSPAAQRNFARLSFVIGSKDNFNMDSDVRLLNTQIPTNLRGLELGLNALGDAAAYIDFHTSASTIDFNSRILAENGTNQGLGQGKLNYIANGGHYFDAPIYVQGTDLKKSVSDGKAAVRAAITGKGGTVADADGDGVPTHAELTNGVNSIQQRQYKVIEFGTLNAGQSATADFGFTPNVIVITGLNSAANISVIVMIRVAQGQGFLRGLIGYGGLYFQNVSGTAAPPSSLTFGVGAGSGTYSQVRAEAWI